MPTDPALAAAIKRLRQHKKTTRDQSSPYWFSAIDNMAWAQLRVDELAIIDAVLADTVTYPEE